MALRSYCERHAMTDSQRSVPGRSGSGQSRVARSGPLTGRKVLVTRSPDRAGALVTALRQAGAEPMLLPLLDFEAVEFSIEDLAAGCFDWLVVSSITTVRALKAAARAAGYPDLSAMIPTGTAVATIGPSSRAVLEAEGVRVALAPEGEQSAAGLVAALPNLAGQSAWLPQSDLAAPLIAEGLKRAGAQVSTTIVYRTVDYPASPRLEEPLAVTRPPDDEALRHLSPEQARKLIGCQELFAVIAASPSAVERIADRLGLLAGTRLVAIGHPTSRAAREQGLDVAAVATEPTPAGIVQALISLLPLKPGPTDALAADAR